MNKHLLTGLSSLLFPMSIYGLPSNAGSYQRSYLRSSGGLGTPLHLSGRMPSPATPLLRATSESQLDTLAGNPVRELVIIDAAVPEKHTFYERIRPGVDVVELNADQDGLEQLQQVLVKYSNLQAVHIVSHADSGVVRLGNSRINAASLYDKLDTFAAINGAVKPSGDILFYGCDLAAGEAGTEFLNILAANTHADIAASDDVTGNGAQGGDWELEIHQGDIEAQQPFSEKALQDFSAILLDQTITMDGFPLGYGEPKTATYGAYTARLSLSDGDPDNDSLNCVGYGECVVDYSGLSTGDKKLYFDFTGGEQFNVTSFKVYTSTGTGDQNLRISSDKGDTTTVNVVNTAPQITVPLNWSGITRLTIEKADGSDIDFARFDDIVLTNIGPAPDNDGTLTAAGGVTEPVTLPTPRDTVGEAVDLFDFTLTDGGGGDGLAMTVSQIVVHVAGTSTDAERGQVIWRLNGPDVSNVTGTYNAGADTITFSGLSISVADSGNETYTLNAYYNDNTNLTEDHTFILSLDGDTDLTVGGSGTQMAAGQSAVNNGTGTEIVVNAVRVNFTTQPAGSVSGAALTTQPVAAAQDAFGNTDVDFTETVTLTEASAGSLSNNTQAAVAGVATFTNLTYTATADQESFTLTANDQDGVGTNLGTTNANAVTSDVVATKLVFDTQPAPTTVSSGQATSFTTVPVVSARDANNVTDTGYSTGIELAEVNGAGSATISGTGDTDGSGSTVTLTPSSGVATFTGLQLIYTNIGASETFNLRASSGGLTTADSNAITSNTPPTVTDGNISISGASGTGGAYKIGDTVTATWNDTAGGDNNSDPINSVTVDFSQFGGGAAVAASNSSDTWTATYTLVSGAIDATNRNISVSATSANGTATTADTTNATVDNLAPTVTDGNISISGATGTGGAYKVGDTITATWNNTAGGDNNSDTISSATVDFSAFGGGAAVAASNSAGTWTATYTVVSGALDATNRNISLTATDNAGNTTTTADTSNATLDNLAPTVTDANISISGASGAGGAYIVGDTVTATWNNTAGGDNNSDTISSVTVDFSAFGGGAAVAASNSAGTWTATYTLVAGAIDAANRNLSVTTTDNAGNTSTTADTTNATVDNQLPSVTSVSVPANATYISGQNLDFTVNYSDLVTVNTGGGTPRLTLTIGATTRYAAYLSGSGTGALVFRYTVQAGDSDSNGIALNGTLDADGGTLRDDVGNNASATLNSVGNLSSVLVDAQGPAVNSVSLPANATYTTGQNLDFTVNYDDNVTVNTGGGTPRLELTIGATTRYASYLSGSGTGALVFRYTVQASDNDSDGIALNSTLQSNGGTLRDGTGNDASTNLGAIGSLAAVLVDALAPTVSSVSVPANATYLTGQNLDFTVNYSENVTVNTGGGTPRLELTIGATTRYADYTSGSGSSALLFRYVVQAGDADADGIALAAALEANGGTLRDAANNDAALALNSVGATAGVLVNTAPLTVTIVLADTSLTAGETSLVTITFSQAVTGFTNADLTVPNASLSAVSSADGGTTWTATLTPSEVTAPNNVITLDNTGVTVVGGGAGTGTTVSANYGIDTVRPSATIVVADTELNLGETSLVTFTFNEAVSGFSNADLSVTNGSLSAVSSANGGITWTATFTPDPDIQVPVNVISLDQSGVLDSVGNAGTGTKDSNNFAIRTQAITLLVTTPLDAGADFSLNASLAADQADGAGLSLREAIGWARSGDTVDFDLDGATAGNQGGTITLGGTQLDIAYRIKIDGDLNDDGVADVTVSGNNTSRVMAIAADTTGVQLTGLALTGGRTSGNGGGLAVLNNASVVVRNAVISNNTSTATGASGGGGGLYGSSANLSLINTALSANTASSFGGGIRVTGAGAVLNLVNSTLSANSTSDQNGGGIHFSGTSLTLVNSTLSGNSANGGTSVGGGLQVAAGNLAIYNSTIVGNAATLSSGGFSASGGSTTLVNTVVAGNTAGAGASAATGGAALATGGTASDVGTTVNSAIHSYFGSNVTIIGNTGSLNNQGTADLLLGNLAANGGTVPTHLPQAGSALIDAGSVVALPADSFDLDADNNLAEPLPLDAAGAARAAGNLVDIGAVEANQAPEFSGLDGGASYTEGGTAVVMDTNVKVSDQELDLLNGGNGNYNGASLTVARSGGANADDVFGFVAGSGIALSAGQLLKNGLAIADFDMSVAGILTLGFTDASGEIPTSADVDAILRQLSYSSLSRNPPASVTIEWIFSDESAASDTQSLSISIVALNSAPSISGVPQGSVVAGLPYLFVPVLDDPEGDNLVVSATNLPAWASLNSASGTLSGTPDNGNAGVHGNITLTVSDGNASASLGPFAIEVLADTDGDGIEDAVDTDDDGDGLPDSVENDLGLDPLDFSDASADADGDGVSNLEEYLAGSNPLVDDYAPVFGALDDMSIKATGLLTQIPTANVPVAVDGLDGDLTAVVSGNKRWFRPGLHHLTWTATDAAGNSAEAVQTLQVLPLMSLGKDQIRAEGSSVRVRFLLNGVSPVYPLTLGYRLAGTADNLDHDLQAGTVTFASGELEQSVTFNILNDNFTEGTETLQLVLDEATTSPGMANFGGKQTHQISIVEQNFAPGVRLALVQNGREVRTLVQDGSPATVVALVDDPNPNDTHSLTWDLPETTVIEPGPTERMFDPSTLAPGVYRIDVRAEELSDIPLSSDASLLFKVIATAPALDANADSDGDGIDDLSEGLGDTDGDGLPDYLDAVALGNVLNERVADGFSFLIEADAGVHLSLGQWALRGTDGAQIDDNLLGAADGIPQDTQPNVGGYFDLVVRDIPSLGASVSIVIPQRQAIPAQPLYRKFADGVWFTFVQDADNSLASAPGEAGVCPPPQSSQYSDGLTPGHWCVQLTIEDGGPNDDDGQANGAIVDPGGVAMPPPPLVHQTRRGGGGALEIPTLLLLLLLVAYRSRRARKALLPSAVVTLAMLTLVVPPQAWAQNAGGAEWWRDFYFTGSGSYASTTLDKNDLQTDFTEAGIDAQVQSVDTSRFAWSLGAGFMLGDRWSVEAGYRDLGDVETEFSLSGNAENLARVHPESGTGWSLSGLYQHPLGPALSLQARLGLFAWREDFETYREGMRVDKYKDSGTELSWGLGMNYQLGQRLVLFGEVERIEFERAPSYLFTLGLRWRLGGN